MHPRATVLITSLAATLLLAVPGSPAPVAAGTPAGPGFVDVAPGDPFFGHITWLAEEGIAEGFPDGRFRPLTPISRAAMAAFLRRAAGSPDVSLPSTPTFPDVRADHPFHADVEWLVGEGITEGYTDGTFRPAAPTSRQAMAAYLHRASGAPAVTLPSTATFPDVPVSHPFRLEVEWLVQEEITTGFSDGRFRPTAAVSRQAMAAFVFRQQHLAPTLAVDGDYVTGRTQPWDVAELPDGQVLFTEAAHGLRIRQVDGDVVDLADVDDDVFADVLVWWETGVMGLTLDPDFTTNRTFYTCQGEALGGGTGRVELVQWTLAVDSLSVSKVAELVDLAPWDPAHDLGRHGGCRPRFDADGHLWLSAGDASCGRYPQDVTALAGKVLRLDVDPDTSAVTAPAGNPFLGGSTADDLVYTYGHRNPQGLAWRSSTGEMWSVEHGPGIDDEVNRLVVPGGNHGWDPAGAGPSSCAYDERVPMTDLTLPGAVPAAWDTGGPTIATSGGTWLEGGQWGGWEDALAVATLKGRHLRVLFFTEGGVFVESRRPAQLDGPFGRLRSPVLAADGDLLLTTSNSTGATGPIDRIVRVQPTP